MLFKLSVKNIRKSLKDYAIYFMTLILGVAIFYIFNSLDSQQAMTELSGMYAEAHHAFDILHKRNHKTDDHYVERHLSVCLLYPGFFDRLCQ